MNDDGVTIGRILRAGDGLEGHLQRVFAQSPAAVWAMLTESSEMAQWLAPGSIEQRLGGSVRIDFADSGSVIDSCVSAFEFGRLLEYSWSSGTQPQRPLRWELSEAAGGTQLRLCVKMPANEDLPKACAGFEGHLEMLAAALEGVPIKFPFDVFLQARKTYGKQMQSFG